MRKTPDSCRQLMGGSLWMYVPKKAAREVMDKFGLMREAALDAITQRFLKVPELSSDFMICPIEEMPSDPGAYTEANPCCIVLPSASVMAMVYVNENRPTRPTNEWVAAKRAYDERLRTALSLAASDLLTNFSEIVVVCNSETHCDRATFPDPMGALEWLFTMGQDSNEFGHILSEFADELAAVKSAGDWQAAMMLFGEVVLTLADHGIYL